MRNVFLSLLLMGVGGCIVSPPSSLEAGNVDVSKGKRYFLRECGRCHDLVYPDERPIQEWRGVLARKKAKVSLTSSQYGQLEKFIMQTAQD